MHGGMNVMIIRKGRRRKSGARHPNGELVGSARRARRLSDLEMAAMQPHRRDMPVIKHNGRPDVDLRLSEKAGTALGSLNLRGVISNDQHEAGRLYSVDCGAYFASIGVPTGLGGGGRGYACPGTINCNPCECLHRKQGYDLAFEALAGAGQKCAKAVAHVAVHDKRLEHGELYPLIRGLNALVLHYGLTSGRKSSNSRNTN